MRGGEHGCGFVCAELLSIRDAAKWSVSSIDFEKKVFWEPIQFVWPINHIWSIFPPRPDFYGRQSSAPFSKSFFASTETSSRSFRGVSVCSMKDPSSPPHLPRGTITLDSSGMCFSRHELPRTVIYQYYIIWTYTKAWLHHTRCATNEILQIFVIMTTRGELKLNWRKQKIP